MNDNYRLNKKLKEKGISRYKLAKATGIYPPDIYNCFSNKKPFYPKWKESIADYLGCEVKDLFDEV